MNDTSQMNQENQEGQKSRKNASIPSLLVLIFIMGLIVMGLWQVSGSNPLLIPRQSAPKLVMGTECELLAIVPADKIDLADYALDAAEQKLRNIEAAQMSWRTDGSDIYRINNAPPGEPVVVSNETLDLLVAARDFTAQTNGAFDVTYAPLFALWRESRSSGKLPTPQQLDQARQLCGWHNFDLQADAVIKMQSGSLIDLGGIAKGYGIDRAVETMQKAGVAGGLVNVGGDIRCFGKRPDGDLWRIGIENPFEPGEGGKFGTLMLKGAAVCTSGNYRRFTNIDGNRYSHIIDPHTGWPARLTPSVTVVAPTAMAADVWATALSILGPRGLELLQLSDPDSEIEAMLVIGSAADYELIKTPGFDKLLEKTPRPKNLKATAGAHGSN